MDSHGIRGVYVPSLWLKDHVLTLNQGFLALGVNAIPYIHGPGGGCHDQLVLLRLQYGSTEFSSQNRCQDICENTLFSLKEVQTLLVKDFNVANIH